MRFIMTMSCWAGFSLFLAAKEPIILKGHTEAVLCVAFSPDGRLLASGGRDATLRLWDPATGQARSVHKKHFKAIQCVAFSPDGRQLLSGGADGSLKFWTLAPTEQRLDIAGHQKALYSAAWHPAGKLVFTGGGDKVIKIWRARDGVLKTQCEGHDNEVRSLALSPDGQWLVSTGGRDKQVRLWSTADYEEKACRTQAVDVKAVAFFPDNKTIALATGQLDKDAVVPVLKIWDRTKPNETIIRHPRTPFAVAISPDGQRLASGGKDEKVYLWEVSTLKRVATFAGHGDEILSLAFSPDGKTLASAAEDGTIRLWSLTP